ncbi:MAG: hypothetical protein ACXABG_15585 [Promethearchaeota archaeon]
MDFLNILQTGWDYIWQNPIAWFLQQSLLSQILILVGIIAISMAAVILIYYILKGVVYLLYYLFKGLYYLFKALFLGIHKLFELIIYGIPGKPKENEKIIASIPEQPFGQDSQSSQLIDSDDLDLPNYCSDCGRKITESLESLLISQGVAFCFYCGNEFKVTTPKAAEY